MSPGGKRKRQTYIQKIYKTVRNPFNKLRAWAKKPGRKGKIKRWVSLKKWAKKRQENAQSTVARAKFKLFRFQSKKKIEWLRHHKDPQPAPSNGGIAYFDGKPVADWIKPWLEKSRNNGWRGTLVSGYRSPEYSEQLCYNICGRPSCPGLCAGRNSNHTRLGAGQGAVDVSDYYNFAIIQRRIGSPLRNNLPSDRVHFSTSGY